MLKTININAFIIYFLSSDITRGDRTLQRQLPFMFKWRYHLPSSYNLISFLFYFFSLFINYFIFHSLQSHADTNKKRNEYLNTYSLLHVKSTGQLWYWWQNVVSVCMSYLSTITHCEQYRETWVQSQVESYQRLKKWYLMPPCLTLSIIRYGSRVK